TNTNDERRVQGMCCKKLKQRDGVDQASPFLAIKERSNVVEGGEEPACRVQVEFVSALRVSLLSFSQSGQNVVKASEAERCDRPDIGIQESDHVTSSNVLPIHRVPAREALLYCRKRGRDRRFSERTIHCQNAFFRQRRQHLHIVAWKGVRPVAL